MNCYSVDMKLKHKQVLLIVVFWLALAAMIFLLDPQEAPLPLLIVPFVLFFAAVYHSTKYFLQQVTPNMSVTRTSLLAVSVSVVPTFLLVLSSVEQLTIRDIILLATLLVTAVFYVRKSHIFNQ